MRKTSSLSQLAAYEDEGRLEENEDRRKRVKRGRSMEESSRPSKLKRYASANDLYDWWSQKLEEAPSLPSEKTQPFIYQRILDPGKTDVNKRLDSVAPKCRDDLKYALARASLIANSMQQSKTQQRNNQMHSSQDDSSLFLNGPTVRLTALRI